MRKVVIDAGHGGKDSGAASNGLKEKDIVLNLAKEIKKRLEAKYEGVECILTRSTDVFLELKERTNLANKLGADLLLSIHCNAGGGAGGFESFTYNGTESPATAAFQNVLHSEIMTRLTKYNIIDRGQKKADLHMCRESKMTAILTENLFLDVANDANKLKRAEVVEAIINGHVSGVAKYLGLKAKESAQSYSNSVVSVQVNGVSIGQGEIKNGVTMAPVRAVAQALGAQVLYDSTNKIVNVITSK